MDISKGIIDIAKAQNVDFVNFVDITILSKNQNKGYPCAILVGAILSKKYIKEVAQNPNHAKEMVKSNKIATDEFHLKEQNMDRLADTISYYILESGYSSYSQSEDNLFLTGSYDDSLKSTPLPHKTIAGLAGLGWIGKNNLMVTFSHGCAMTMCSVLTDAPLETIQKNPLETFCGDCTLCLEYCTENALTGNTWDYETGRDELVNIKKCTTCLQCMMHCIWTQRYVNP